MEYFGFLNIDKPEGLSSRRAVDRVKRLVKPAKVGHAGTLDPIATGVLVVGVGHATRLVEYVQRMPKRYVGTFLLGRRSESDDIESEVEELAAPPVPGLESLQQAAARFIGTIEQRPPIFSALKLEGKRAYELARRGKPVELAPRPITIYKLEIVEYEYPRLKLALECSGGTYVRAVGRDLAESLGTAAVMSALVRTAVGNFTLERAMRLEELDERTLVERMAPPAEGLAGLGRIVLEDHEVALVLAGREIARPCLVKETSELAALDRSGRLVAVLRRIDPRHLRADRAFHPTT
ncbi:MAG: tRNA pseudouridine(55) synthase TruB [Pirellulales bacterium]|nr:tRNA pseudouridine(55) synthase TruB [Pirellulales bacterium]